MEILEGRTDSHDIWYVDNDGDIVYEDLHWVGIDNENYKTLLTKNDLQKMLKAIEHFEASKEDGKMKVGARVVVVNVDKSPGYEDEEYLKVGSKGTVIEVPNNYGCSCYEVKMDDDPDELDTWPFYSHEIQPLN